MDLTSAKDLIASLKIGDQIKLYYGEYHFGNCLYHIQGFVDDQVVMKSWMKRKQRWTYECFGISWFYVYSRQEEFSVIRSNR